MDFRRNVDLLWVELCLRGVSNASPSLRFTSVLTLNTLFSFGSMELMDILLNTRVQETPGPTVEINCPACQATSVSAESKLRVERLEVFYFLPVFQSRQTFVCCSACNKSLLSSVSIEEMERLSADELSAHLVTHVSFVHKFVAVLSLVLCILPVIGFGLGLIGVALNWRTVGWPKTLSCVGAVIGGLVTITLAVLMAVL